MMVRKVYGVGTVFYGVRYCMEGFLLCDFLFQFLREILWYSQGVRGVGSLLSVEKFDRKEKLRRGLFSLPTDAYAIIRQKLIITG